jgi:hypothetical protein
MQDLYNGFKKVSEDDKSAVLQHESGHKLNIAKSGLNKKQISMLKKLPLYQAEGTNPVEELEKPEEEAGKAVGKQIASSVFENVLKGVEEGAMSSRIPTEELVQREPELAPARRQAPVDYLREGLSDFFSPPEKRTGLAAVKAEQERYEQENPLIQQPARQPSLADATTQQPTEGLAAQPTATAAPTTTPAVAAPATEKPKELALPEAMPSATPETAQAEDFVRKSIETQQKIVAQDEEFYREMMDPKNEIKPVDLFTNKDVFGSIGTIAGLLISGIGAGLSGTENMAMNYLNKQIDREVEAQKANRERKFNLYKMHREGLKDSVAADLQTATNLRQIALMRMDEMMGLVGNNQMARTRLAAAANDLKLKIANDQQALTSLLMNKQRLASLTPTEPGKLVAADPTAALGLIKDEKLRERVSKEISRRKTLVKAGPSLMKSVKKSFKDYQSIYGQTIGRIKVPESVKDLELEIRGIIPEQEGDVTGQQREAKVQSLLKLLQPGPNDAFDENDYKKRIAIWLQQNIQTPASDEARSMNVPVDLDAYEATAIRPDTWGGNEEIERMDPKTGRVVVYDAKTKKPLRYK